MMSVEELRKAGDLFTCEKDAERIEDDSLEAAVVSRFEAVQTGEGVLADIATFSPVRVYAYKNRALPAGVAEDEADTLVTDLMERLDDEYGDPDGDTESVAGKDDVAALREAFVKALTPFLAKVRVYWVDQTGYAELSAAEVESILRAEQPELFEEGA